MYPTTRDKTIAKCLSKFLKGIYEIGPQTIEPSHCHRSQTGGKYFAHQSLILRMDSHSLVELAHMFYGVRSTIINGERRLMESLRKFCHLYLARERWFEDLIQRLTHSVVSQAFTRWAFVSSLVVVLFIVGERLAWWSSGPLPVTSILFIIGRDVETGKSSFSLCMA